MKKDKGYWYVLVCTDNGPIFVMDVDNSTKVAEWDMDKKPYQMPEYMAKDLAVGLRCNLNLAYAIYNGVEITHQPYHYSSGKFEWKENKKEG